MRSQPNKAVAARHAATVILVRDGSRGLELFMMKRHVASDFVGGAHVFPGGRVDPEDHVPTELCEGHDDGSASRILGLDHGGLAFWVAAIRECFEEAGVLLAYGGEGADPSTSTLREGSGRLLEFCHRNVTRRFEQLRSELNAGRLSLLDIARQEGLRLATDRMHYWAHWITPEGQPIRYDTRFFLAKAPRHQIAAHDDHELTDSAWVTPREALARADRGEWTVIFPTRRNLMLLVDFESADEAVDAARRRSEVPTMQPRMRKMDGGIQLLLPGDDGYEEAGAEPPAPPASRGARPRGEP